MSTNPETPIINADVTVADLLRHYPQLDEPLACLVPAYRALSSSLRQTISTSPTLHQLAANGEVPIEKLITALREAAGQHDRSPDVAVPSWVAESTPAVTYDARPVLADGGHPLGAVMQGLTDLGPHAVYQMLTPFVPAPLIDMARSLGFEAFSVWDGDVLRTYFRKV